MTSDDQLAEPHEVGDLSQFCLLQGGEARVDYSLGRISLANEVDFSSIIIITALENSFLCALPRAVWNRKVAKRLLSPQGLRRPVACTVPGFPPGSGEEEDESAPVLLWLGILSIDLLQLVDFDELESNYLFSGEGGEILYPAAQGLADAASELFQFVTAESGGGGGPVQSQGDRIARLETMMAQMNANIAQLAQKDLRAPALRPAGSKSSPSSKAAPRVKFVAPEGDVDYSGLDPKVVEAARSAGVPEEHLAEMALIVKRQPTRMEDLPRSSTPPVGGGLSESDDEEAEVDASLPLAGSAAGGVAQAIVKLTQVCSALAKDKRSRGKDLVEQILDGPSLGGSGEGSGLGSSRKNAAALRALKKALVEKPEYIYETIENHLKSDFETQPSRPGQPLGGASIRGWLESRSRIQNYTSHVRWSWGVAGIWDALVRGDTKQARARAALMVAAADQAAIDGGSWLMASVALLEPPAPYHSFSHHQSPSSQDLQHSVLLDPRWMEVFLAHVKDLDSYQEAKKRLGKSPSASTPSLNDKDPRPKPKSKPKAKGKGAGKKEEVASEEAGAS